MRLYHRILTAALIVLALQATAFAQQSPPSPKIVLLENPEPGRPPYPLLLSKGRGYRIQCRTQTETDNIIRGLGALTAPLEIVDLSNSEITDSAPQSNPLLCPYAENDYKIKLFSHESNNVNGLTYYLWFPTGFESDVYKDRLYIPGCIGLLNSLGLKTFEAVHADPTVFFSKEQIHTIECLSGEPVQYEPAPFAHWCIKKDRTYAETATVRAMLNATPVGSSGINNSAECKRADSFLNSLTALDLNGKGLRSLAPLAGLNNLTYLDLSENEISSTTALALLTNLKTLNLSGNTIRQIDPLSSLTNLESLDLERNRMKDIRSLTFLQEITSLKHLNLSGNQIVDIIPLANLTQIIELSLEENKIRDINPVAELTGLTSLNLTGNQIVDISPLSSLGNLKQLSLARNNISDVSALATLSKLENLNLGKNNLTDIDPLKNLINIKTLALYKNKISEISPIAKLINLEELNVAHNKVGIKQVEVKQGTLVELTPLINLKRLIAHHNFIYSYYPFGPDFYDFHEANGREIAKLQYLDVRYNFISSFNYSIYDYLSGYFFMEGNPACYEKLKRRDRESDAEWKKRQETFERLQNTACINTPEN